MEIDQAVMQSLPFHHRQKLCRQLRQEQIRQYSSWILNEPSDTLKKKKTDSPKTKKKKSTSRAVYFADEAKLWDAVVRFDDREVLLLLEAGQDPNYISGSGIPLLSKCAIEDNLTAAEALVQHGADVNLQDRDLWTPLHYAASTDHPDLVQLFLTYEADITVLDVDGNYALDHAPENSESRDILHLHYSEKGLDENHLNELRLQKPRAMFQDVNSLVQGEKDLNQTNEQGISLLHIACANGFSRVSQLLVKSGVDCNGRDNQGWTALHAGAKYGQKKSVKMLLNVGADPYLLNHLEQKPSDLAMNDDIKNMLLDAESRKPNTKQRKQSEAGEEDGMQRINSKTLRPRHTPFSKSDELFEAKTRAASRPASSSDEMSRSPVPQPSLEETEEEEEEYYDDDIYENLKFGNVQERKAAGLPTLQEVAPGDDLAKLPEITEDIIVSELHKRYLADRIYTNMGDILVSVNPFKSLPIYTKAVSQQYHDSAKLTDLPPHVYAVAEQAYRALLRERRSQCCIISGESGAGKTETCKYAIQHLLLVAHSEEGKLNRRIQQVNPLLEAFGNAQTVMNNNSSRFGKFLEIMFSDSGAVLGAKIHEYLLESSRVVYQAAGETNFHIFYLLFAGLTPEECRQYSLSDPSQHRYLQAGTCENSICQNPVGDTNKVKFSELKDCLGFVGFSKDDISNLLVSLVGILHLGDVQFRPVGNNDAAQVSNPSVLAKAASLLNVSEDELSSSLVADIHITRGEQIRKERTVLQACDCRDALAKALYRRLFSWIVNGINQMIQPLEGNGPPLEIGILDIFGFENFPRNSFEQLCINLANEQLQHYFNEHIFNMEIAECKEEGVDMASLSFSNNKPILDLFLEKPLGILSILDEESRFPKATDASLATKLHSSSGKTQPSIYLAPKDGGPSFAIMHYAGKVTYDLIGVLEKVRDTLPVSILFTMKTSSNLLIKDMFQSRITRTGSLAPSVRQTKSRKSVPRSPSKSPFDFFKKKPKIEMKSRKTKPTIPDPTSLQRKGPTTVAYHFKQSLNDLVTKMNASIPHFVRCIKPNVGKISTQFGDDYVKTQLKYSGIMETIRIRKQGYPMRIKFGEFLERYATLRMASKSLNTEDTEFGNCSDILQFSKVQDYKVGKTRLFLRYWHVENLEIRANQLSTHICNIQRATRGWLARRQYQQQRALKQQQTIFVERFFDDIASRTTTTQDVLVSTNEEDLKRHQVAQEKMQLEEEQMDPDVMSSLLELDKVVDGAEGEVIQEEESGLQRDIFQSLEALDKVVAEAEQEEEDPMLFGNEEVRKSIEALDSIIDEYDEDYGFASHQPRRRELCPAHDHVPPPPHNHHHHHHHHHHHVPTGPSQHNHMHQHAPPPPDIAAHVISTCFPQGPPQAPPPQQPPPMQRPRSGSHEFTLCCHHQHQQGLVNSPSQNSILRNQEYSTGPKRHPPQVPRRNPETRLSVSSESSQQDDVAPPPREYDDTPESGYQTSEVDTQGSEFEYPLHPGGSVPYRGGHGGREYYAHSDTQSLYGSETPSPSTAPRAPPVPPNSLMGIDTGFRGSTSSIPGFPPPPPPGDDEETFTTHLPGHFDDMAAADMYGVSLPQSNGYSEGAHELYGTTLPKPLSELRHPPATVSKKPPVPPPGPTAVCPPPLAPPQFPLASPDRDFPPPPPPLEFADGSPKRNVPPTAPKPRRGSGPGSPVFSATMQPPRHQDTAPPPPPLATMPRLKQQPDVVPRPPAGAMPGDLLSNGGAPPPPPTSTIPRQLNRNVPSPPRAPSPPGLNNGSLAAQLARVQLRAAEAAEEEERPAKPGGQPHARHDLISQIQHGVPLKSSPLGNKIRGDADDLSPPNELAPPPPPLDLLDHTAAPPHTDNTLSKPPPPPTLPKTKAVVRAANWGKLVKEKSKDVSDYDEQDSALGMEAEFENIPEQDTQSQSEAGDDECEASEVPTTMPSGGEQPSHSAGIDIDPRTIPGFQEVPENCPTWKKAMIEKKNKQLEDDTKKTLIAQREEEERWKGVPEWKKKIIMEKQKKKADDEALSKTEQTFTEEQVAKMKDMPEWKRDLLRKKRGDV